MTKRRPHSPSFRARVAMEAISHGTTLQEIDADNTVHPIQVSQRKKQRLEGASNLFLRDTKTQDTDDQQARGLLRVDPRTKNGDGFVAEEIQSGIKLRKT